jgi:hypothetical protein
MAFIRNTGLTKTMYFPKAASTAITLGAALKFDGSGNVTPSTSSDATVLGISQRAVASTDTDYASNTLIPVEVPVEKGVEFLALVETGTATAANVGLTYDLNDSLGVNLNGTSHNAFTVTRFISATQVAVVFKGVLN